MSDTENSFVALFGKQPTDAARERMLRIKDSLGIRDNDALWSVLLALESYQALYEQIPEQIEARSKTLLIEFRKAAKAAAEASSAQSQKELSEAVSRASTQVAEDVAKQHRATATKKLVEWLIVAVVIITMSAAGLTFSVYKFAHDAGVAEGHANGYERARSEKAAAAWANTAEGRMAEALSRAGALTILARCLNKGWVVKDGACYPHADERGNVHGWRLPRSER